MRRYKTLVGLVVLAGLLILSAFAILNIYAKSSFEEFTAESEAALLKSLKLNYQNLTAEIDTKLNILVDNPGSVNEVIQSLSDEIEYVGLFDYSGNLLRDFGYSSPASLSSSLFFENLTFSSGYPKTEMTLIDGRAYIQTGILMLDDTILLVVLDKFDGITDKANSIYERMLNVYFGNEDDFASLNAYPMLDYETLNSLFTKTMNSQKPEAEEISVEDEKATLNAIAVYDSDNWEVIGFFTTITESSEWSEESRSMLIFLWISAFSSSVFAMLFLYLLFRRSQSSIKMKRSVRFLLGFIAYLPAIILFGVFAFSLFGNSLSKVSSAVALKNAKGWFSDASSLLGYESERSLKEFVDRSKRVLSASFIIKKDDNIVVSNLSEKRIANLEIMNSFNQNDMESGKAKVNDVVHTYVKKNIDGFEFTILFEETSRENSILSIQFFSIGAILVLLVMVVVSTFIISNIESQTLINRTLIGYGFLLPALVHLVWWAVGPMGFALFLAFRRWSIVDAAKPFVGFGNFIELFSDLKFWNAMKNTAVYSIYVPIGMFISLLLAIAVNKLGKLSIVLRVLYYLPVVTAGVATTIVWRWIFNRDFGVLNFILGLVGIKSIAWLESPQFALISMMIIGIWSAIGSQLLIFLAGLQGIPKDFYDAAAVDGASKPRIFWKITLPLLKPTSLFVLVTSVIGSFQVFTPIYVLTQGGPLRSTDVVFYHIWQSAWVDMRMGYAAAQSWILFLLLAALTLVEFKLFGKESWQAYF